MTRLAVLNTATEIIKTRLPVCLCTIYYLSFSIPVIQKMAVARLAIFNDCIVEEALRNGFPVIDLRAICNEDRDYANPIEPSAHGGEKIVDAILKVVTEFDSGNPRMIIVT